MVAVGKIYSILGNNSSLIPIGIKDVANGTGMTLGAYITGDKTESKDRFIDEFGTEAIWLLGIPFYKKVLDLLLYKPFKLDPDVDVRLINNPELAKKAIKYAPNKDIKDSIENALKHKKLSKGLFISRFIASTVLTAISYFSLTKFRHKYTENQIKKDYFIKHKESKHFKNQVQFSSAIEQVKSQKQVAFTGGIKDFMFDPVKNLMLVDASITGERLTHARNEQDFIGYVIKEGSVWTFLYFAGKKFQTIIENNAIKKYNKSINLDARTIESEELQKYFENKTIDSEINEFCEKTKNGRIYEFINEHPDNFIVKSAKQCDIIPTLKNGDSIDTRKFIDTEAIKLFQGKIKNLYEQYKVSGESSEKFLLQVKKLKRSATLKNIGLCIGALGILTPLVMVLIRLSSKNNKEFQTKKDILEKLARQN